MSAIFGLVRFDDAAVVRSDVERMAATMKHRMPDGQRIRVDGPVALGHGSMQVVAQDRYESQPLIDESGDLAVVTDARLDNRETLAAELGIDSRELATMPESAMILAAYRRWGERCAEHLLGDFAFAIWNGRSRELLLGRDHMGQRYVHYHLGSGFVAFATEAKALHALAAVPRALDAITLARLLGRDLFGLDERTMFAGISGIPGGTTLRVGASGAHAPRRYWTIGASDVHLGQSDDYYYRTYRALLAEAVGCRLRRLVAPPGLLLSGGFDSAAIAGLAGDALPRGIRLMTATSALPEGARDPHDARPRAQACADAMPHVVPHWHVRDPGVSLADEFERRAMVHEEPPPLLDHALDGLYRLLRGAGCRLAMDGLGGDATINPRVRDHLANRLRAGDLRGFVDELLATGRHEGVRLRRLLLQTLLKLIPRRLAIWARRLAWRLGRPPAHWFNFANAELLERLRMEGAVAPIEFMRGYHRATEAERRVMILENLRRQARPRNALPLAAAGLILTRPMLDKRLVEFGLAIPERLHTRGGRQRDLARRALGDLLPPDFQSRRSGQEHFDPDLAPLIDAFQHEIDAGIVRLEDSASIQAYFDVDKLKAQPPRSDRARERQRAGIRARSYMAARYVAWFEGRNA